MKIKNTTHGDIGLDFETIVPAGGEIEIDAADAKRFEASEVVKAWFETGALEIEQPKRGRKPKAAEAAEGKDD